MNARLSLVLLVEFTPGLNIYGGHWSVETVWAVDSQSHWPTFMAMSLFLEHSSLKPIYAMA